MYHYIKGKATVKTPAYIVLETAGVGYEIHISLHTYSKIESSNEFQLYTYLHIKEDAHTLYGFFEVSEKLLFTQLISISGVGPNTARMMLSSFPPEDIKWAIINEDVKLIQSIKGIGPKTAQRVILELKDKLQKTGIQEMQSTALSPDNTLKEEALSALLILGFSKSDAEKAIQKALKQDSEIRQVEGLIKLALKNL